MEELNQINNKNSDKKIKLVAFDLYGVCANCWNSFSILKEIEKEIAENLKLDSIKDIRNANREVRKILLTQPVDIEKPIILKNWSKILLSEGLIKKIKENINWIWLYDDFLDTIQELKKRWYKTAVVSNLAQIYEAPLRNGLIPPDTFDYEVLSFEVWDTKPNPKMFEYLHEISWVDYNQTFFVWDRFWFDIEWAWKKWINPALICRPENIEEDGEIKNMEKRWIKYIQISTLKQLLQIL